MKRASTREIYAYWNALRAGRAAPERSEIDPAAIRNVLADTFILELEDEVQFRVAGARIGAIFGSDLKSRPLHTIVRSQDRRSLERLIWEASEELIPACAAAIASPRGRIHVDLEILFLPLRHHGRKHARMLGAIAPAAIPSWFGILTAGPMTIIESSPLDKLTDLFSLDVEGDQAERGLQASQADPSRRRHLFVHEGGRRDS